MDKAQRYRCACGGEKVLPESPTDGEQTVTTGCESCGRIRTHYAVGRHAEVFRIRHRGRTTDHAVVNRP